MTTLPGKLFVAAWMSLIVTLASCRVPDTDFTSLRGTPPHGEDQCVKVDAPMTDIAPRNGEPHLRLPQPPGWEPATRIDTQRIAFADKGLSHDGFAPTAGVTIAEGNVTRPSPEQDSISMEDRLLRWQRDNLVAMGGATGLVVAPRTICGYPAETITYTAPPKKQRARQRTATQLAVIAETTPSRYYIVNLVVETTDPENPAYQHDCKLMLDGFQVLPQA